MNKKLLKHFQKKGRLSHWTISIPLYAHMLCYHLQQCAIHFHSTIGMTCYISTGINHTNWYKTVIPTLQLYLTSFKCIKHEWITTIIIWPRNENWFALNQLPSCRMWKKNLTSFWLFFPFLSWKNWKFWICFRFFLFFIIFE